MEIIEKSLGIKVLNKINKYFLIFILFLSCSTNRTSPYLNDLSSTRGEFVNHFPKTQVGLLGYYSLLPQKNFEVLNKGNYISGTFDYKKIENDIKANFGKMSRYFPNDTCQLIISRISDIVIKKNCVCETLPIPDFLIEIDKYNFLGKDFNIEEVEFDKVKLPKDFEYYVDAKSGVFIEEQYLFKDSFMPGCWEHGYSKGYAISKKRNIAIIWLEIW
jgi:hypothetical protein